MSNDIKFWLISTILMLFFSIGGYFLVFKIVVDYLLFLTKTPKEATGLEMLTFGAGGLIGGLAGFLFGFLLALIFIRRLGKRWGSQLNFGKHPVLKLTTLAFLTFLIITFILMIFFANLAKR